MTNGWISDNWELVMPMRILDANEHVHRVEAHIDTGFNGQFTLPHDFIELLGIKPTRPIALTMANGETETFQTFLGMILWQGRRSEVRIIESAGAPLIGTELLWGSLLTAEMTDNGAVTIGPLSAGVSG